MDTDISIAHQSGIAVAAVFALDYLKRAAWFPWLSKNTETVNRVVSLIVALATASGLKVLSGDSVHGWVIAIPPLAVIFDTLTHAAAQFGGQELLHKLLGNHQIGKETLAQLTQLNEAVKQLQLPQA